MTQLYEWLLSWSVSLLVGLPAIFKHLKCLSGKALIVFLVLLNKIFTIWVTKMWLSCHVYCSSLTVHFDSFSAIWIYRIFFKDLQLVSESVVYVKWMDMSDCI